MEGFIKVPKNVFNLELNSNEFKVLMRLLYIQDYREFKGEVEDGWFAKSQNELANECGLKSHNTLLNVLRSMSKNNIVKFRPTNTVTYFKITMSKNDIPTTSNNDIPTTSKIDYLHKNNKQEITKQEINKEKEIGNNINITITSKEKERELCNVNIIDEFEDKFDNRFMNEIKGIDVSKLELF
jgi:hypothetical protein